MKKIKLSDFFREFVTRGGDVSRLSYTIVDMWGEEYNRKVLQVADDFVNVQCLRAEGTFWASEGFTTVPRHITLDPPLDGPRISRYSTYTRLSVRN